MFTKQDFDDWLMETARMITTIPPFRRERMMDLFSERKEELGLGPAAEAVMARLFKPGRAEMIVDYLKTKGVDCSVR